MSYAVIKIKGKQFKVSQGDQILVGLHEEKEEIQADVLLTNIDGKLNVGDPIVKKAKIKMKRLANEQGKKIHVKKFKSKSRYRKKIGFRPIYTRFEVENISI